MTHTTHYGWTPFPWVDHYERSIAHHEARAAYWRAQGNESYALASLQKAARWEDHKRAYLSLLAPKPSDNPELDNLLKMHMQSIEERVRADFERALYGT